ncbi:MULTISPECIES: alpha/beta hydrolase [unclassified Streptomyces]|uniref:alpha/beta hydrolase n=1 Tax=unclassified Streptomyces TaxID=2593676 RepID=UPI000DBAB81F|nr:MULTISPECIES: alpha/beta hydrolase [unclassified Streptomyces]MYT75943.1 alpha/beta fold hydrolase [Streptomyces sp. SID8367]RAJ77774.1 TAP-like protein [Streptomyces sp. PsTaAH-137]
MAPGKSRARARTHTGAGAGTTVRALGLISAVLLTAGLITACTDPGEDGDSAPAPVSSSPRAGGSRSADATPRAATLPALPAALTSQHLRWGRCRGTASTPAPGSDWQCTTLKAPLDYARPTGRTIGLALIRARSRGAGKERIGSLLFNFGGPGGSGVDRLPAFAPQYTKLWARYDLVSFDPRGAGASRGVRCRSDKEIQTAESIDPTPDTAAEESAYFKDATDFGKGCARQAADLLSHVSTTEAARDMDLMRQVLGDDELHYMGFSYGTELGGVYAHLFPAKVGRLTLDAVVDPTVGTVGHSENQARGFQRALDDYFTSRGRDPKEGSREIAALFERLDAKPLPTAGGRELTESLATTGVLDALYSTASWPALTRGLRAADRGDGTTLLALADSYNDRDTKGHYGTTTHAQRAISCRDDRERPTAARAKSLRARFRAISPVFGEAMAWDTAGWCHDWPVPGLWDDPDVSAPDAAPVLVVGNTGDPATPYEGAHRMADELGKGVGVELTWKGEGHGAYGSGSACVDSTVNAYLLEGRIPRDGKVCS